MIIYIQSIKEAKTSMEKVILIRKCHYHTLQTNPQLHEEETEEFQHQESKQLSLPQQNDCKSRSEFDQEIS